MVASAFPASRVRGLGAEDQGRFADLVRRHGARLEEHLQALESQWAQLPDGGSAPEAPIEEQERLAVQDLEPRTARISELAEALFAGLEIAGAEAEECWMEIRRLTRQLNEWRRMSAAAEFAAWLGPDGEDRLVRGREKE